MKTTPGAASPTGARIPSQNQVILVGRLTKDPDIRMTQTGRAMCRFDIAVNRSYQNKATGQWVEDTTYVPIISWGPVAESLRDAVKKGTAVRIEGRLQSREFEDKTGAKRKVLEVMAFKVEVLAQSKGGGPAPAKPRAAEPAAAQGGDEDMEEVPF